MKKKNIFLILIIVIIGLGVAGFFYWENREIKGSPDDYVIQETSEGKFVENKRAGLRVKVPEGWTERKIDVIEGSMVFYSPDAEGYRPEKIKPPLKKGCFIEIGIAYKKMNFDEIRKEIKEIHEGLHMEIDKIETVNINDNMIALKNEFKGPFLGWGQAVYIPDYEKLYNMGLSAGPEDIERCSQEFDKFLEGVVIE